MEAMDVSPNLVTRLTEQANEKALVSRSAGCPMLFSAIGATFFAANEFRDGAYSEAPEAVQGAHRDG